MMTAELEQALVLIEEDRPLPLTLVSALHDQGIDVDELVENNAP